MMLYELSLLSPAAPMSPLSVVTLAWNAQAWALKLALIGPGLPGQPMYYVVPAKAANIEAAVG